MTPDDPRHGTWAGRLAHWKEGSEACQPCKDAAFRRNKRVKRRLAAGVRYRVPIGEKAWRIVLTTPTKDLAAETGIARDSFQRMRRNKRGPAQIVNHRTREKILAAAAMRQPVTVVGLARRLQGLSYMGHSMHKVARESDCSVDTLRKIQRGETHTYISRQIQTIILDAYRRHAMVVAPKDQSSDRTRAWAASFGYASPLAWDDETIDDPKATPVGVGANTRPPKTEVDDAAVFRAMLGDRTVDLTKAERIEVCRRLRAEGLPDRRIEERTGLKVDRYLQKQREVAA